MDVANECSSNASTDECRVASAIFACNKKNNPSIANAVLTLVNSSFDTPTAAAAASPAEKKQCVLTPWRKCPPQTTCTVDSARRTLLLGGGTDHLGGKLSTSTDGIQYYVGNVLQTYSSAAMECCLIGMRVAEFATPEIYTNWWSASGALAYMGRCIYIGATYNNGDGTDSWCSNFALIPDNIITNKTEAYENCYFEFKTQRLVLDESKNSHLLTPENLDGAHLFACSSL